MPDSSYAQYALCAAASVRPLPFNISYEMGAAVNVSYRTAYRALFLVGLLLATLLVPWADA